MAQVGERVAGSLAAEQHLAPVGLDAYRSVLLEDAAAAGSRIRREDHMLSAGGHARLDVAHSGALEL